MNEGDATKSVEAKIESSDLSPLVKQKKVDSEIAGQRAKSFREKFKKIKSGG